MARKNLLRKSADSGFLMFGLFVVAYSLDCLLRVLFHNYYFAVFTLGLGGFLCGRYGVMVARYKLMKLGDD